MELKVAIGILEEYYRLHYDYPDKQTTKDFQEIKYAMQTILTFCNSMLEAKGMPQDKEYPHDNTGNNECYLCSEVRGYNQANAEWLPYHSKIMSRINAKMLERVKLNTESWDEFTAAIIAVLKEGK